MGLILDSSVAIAGERGGLPVEDLLAFIRGITGATEIALSVLSVMELGHGIWRAKDETRARRGGSSWRT
jgi:predicted nucleic acid-binding protein